MTFFHSFTGKEPEKPLDFGLKGDIVGMIPQQHHQFETWHLGNE